MKRIVTFSLSLFSALGLLKIFSIVPFNRMAADDFSYANAGIQKSFWTAQINWYMTWTGRFTSTFLQTFFSISSGGEGKAIVYSIITFLLLLFAFIVFYSRFLNIRFRDIKVILLSVASFVTLYLLTPNKSESWYWMTGSITYLWPIILFIFGISYIFVKKIKPVEYVLAFLFIFFATGGNETFGLVTLTFFGIILLYSLVTKRLNKAATTIFLGSLISFTLVYLSPGNANRAAGGASDQMNWLGSLAYSLQTGPLYMFSLALKNTTVLLPLLIVFSFFLSTVLISEKLGNLEDALKKIFVVVTLPVLLSIIYMIPGFRILGRVPPDRSDITLSFIILCSFIALTYCLSLVFSQSNIKKSSILITLIFLSALGTFVISFKNVSTFASDIYIAKNYSDSYDGMIAKLRSSSRQNTKTFVSVPKFPDSGLITPVQIQYEWIRVAISQYYKVPGIINE